MPFRKHYSVEGEVKYHVRGEPRFWKSWNKWTSLKKITRLLEMWRYLCNIWCHITYYEVINSIAMSPLVLWRHHNYCYLTAMSVQIVCIETDHTCFTTTKFYILLLVLVQPYWDWTKCKTWKKDWREKQKYNTLTQDLGSMCA